MQHPVWSALPPPAAAVVADVHPLLEPLLVPRAPEHLTSHQMLFCPAEDELLALGLQRYGYDWPRIWAELLPTKSLAQLKNRRKNRCAGNAPDNCIKVRRRQGGPGAFRSGGGGACCLQARSSSR
jgi:hypothetical protein